MTKTLADMKWNATSFKWFNKFNGPSFIIECLNKFKDKPLLDNILSTFDYMIPVASDVPGCLSSLPKKGLIPSILKCLSLGVSRSTILAIFYLLRHFISDSILPSHYEPLMLEVLSDSNSTPFELYNALYLMDSTTLSSLSNPQLISATIPQLSNNKVDTETRIKATSFILEAGGRGQVDPSFISEVAKKAPALLEECDAKTLHRLIEVGMHGKLLEFGLVEVVTHFLAQPGSSETIFYGTKALIHLIEKNSQNQLLALSAGALPSSLQLLSSQLGATSIGETFAFELVNQLLENTMSHSDFVGFGGVRLYSEVLAKWKFPKALEMLYRIGRESEPLLQIIASDPALSAQMAVGMRGESTNLKIAIMKMMALISDAGIPIHRTLSSQSIPVLLDALTPDSSLPLSLSLSLLASFSNTTLFGIGMMRYEGRSIISNIDIDTLGGQDRINAQRLQAKLPNREEEIKKIKNNPITSESYEAAFEELANGTISARGIYSLLHLTLTSSSPSKFYVCEVAPIVAEKEIVIDLELELATLLLLLELTFPEQIPKVEKCNKHIHPFRPECKSEMIALIDIYYFIGMNYCDLLLLLLYYYYCDLND